jgi:hypothetical protein
MLIFAANHPDYSRQRIKKSLSKNSPETQCTIPKRQRESIRNLINEEIKLLAKNIFTTNSNAPFKNCPE